MKGERIVLFTETQPPLNVFAEFVSPIVHDVIYHEFKPKRKRQTNRTFLSPLCEVPAKKKRGRKKTAV